MTSQELISSLFYCSMEPVMCAKCCFHGAPEQLCKKNLLASAYNALVSIEAANNAKAERSTEKSTLANPAPATDAGHNAQPEDADLINHPAHYTYGKRECIDEMRILFGDNTVLDYCKCAAYKYRYRAGHKGDADDAQCDLGKADWYIDYARKLEF